MFQVIIHYFHLSYNHSWAFLSNVLFLKRNSDNFYWMPKNYADRAIEYVKYDSKYSVRCCSINGTSCSSKPCKRLKTYEEAEKICNTRGERLCQENEMNLCCKTGCVMDPNYVWVAGKIKGKSIENTYTIQIF